MQLKQIEDPRDGLSKARRWELEQFAKANNVTEVQPGMPAVLMRNILRSKGITRIPIPNRPLGQQNQPNPRPMYRAPVEAQRQPDQKVVEVNADADLARQFQQQPKPTGEMSITEMRQECKRRGIKMERRDNMQTLRAKLSG